MNEHNSPAYHTPTTAKMQFTTLLLAGAAIVSSAVNAVPIYDNSTVNAVPTYGNTTFNAKSSAHSNFTFVSKAKANPICQDCMSCTTKQKSIVLEYRLHIGAPFANGGGCEPIKKSLQEASRVSEISDYSCKDDGFGYTKIRFTAWDYNQGWEISQVFNRAYPAVKAKMSYGFNCGNFRLSLGLTVGGRRIMR
ncbi:uncharacterized protein CLAFUR5_10242 [Fulvia fulva]|uniref:Uncharacterized protein n=1 Tax=Passalora fulva TaxID=5499 RepID=A0A9Q8URB5_PASFU|nr:uncharacterized protein CLAFUR5_10242 [Fulvia fulva]UJO19555.1 hypothetical protein CLAFUR5_10242 [Fulvia fulva]